MSGATRTGAGVTNLLHFWLGDLGYAPLLRNLRAEADWTDDGPVR